MTGRKLLKQPKLRNNEYYDMQSVFDELYKNSLAKCEFKNLISIITTEENIRLAYRNLKKNAGSKTPGTDGKTIMDLAKMSEPELIGLVRQKFKWYQPQSVRRKEIPKGNGKTRPLGIPTITDRLIQQCILQVMEPICEAQFCDTSNGFRPNRGVENALAQAEKHMQKGNLHIVIDIDIKGFFDNVNHGKLLRQIWAMGIHDKKLLNLIILHERIHRLIHATQKDTISEIMQTVQLDKRQLEKLNKLRKSAGNEAITFEQQKTCC